ncbi:MAG: hypothetical protein KAS32_09815 [Candidatus Peribacteraceae bacterium]|nr:hypothetical protein [Candidatus Peribacteraceae bacterium]
MDIKDVKVGQILTLDKARSIDAGYFKETFGIGKWDTGQEFKVIIVNEKFVLRIGVMPIIEEVVTPNMHGVHKCLWLYSEDIRSMTCENCSCTMYKIQQSIKCGVDKVTKFYKTKRNQMQLAIKLFYIWLLLSVGNVLGLWLGMSTIDGVLSVMMIGALILAVVWLWFWCKFITKEDLC